MPAALFPSYLICQLWGLPGSAPALSSCYLLKGACMPGTQRGHFPQEGSCLSGLQCLVLLEYFSSGNLFTQVSHQIDTVLSIASLSALIIESSDHLCTTVFHFEVLTTSHLCVYSECFLFSCNLQHSSRWIRKTRAKAGWWTLWHPVRCGCLQKPGSRVYTDFCLLGLCRCIGQISSCFIDLSTGCLHLHLGAAAGRAALPRQDRRGNWRREGRRDLG